MKWVNNTELMKHEEEMKVDIPCFHPDTQIKDRRGKSELNAEDSAPLSVHS